MSDKVTMVAEIAHQTGTPAGMVQVGDEFEVSEAIARAYEDREKRPLAVRKGSASKRETRAPAKAAAKKTAPRKATARKAAAKSAASTEPEKAGE